MACLALTQFCFLILRKLHHGKKIYITKFAILTKFRCTVALIIFFLFYFLLVFFLFLFFFKCTLYTTCALIHTTALSTFTLLYSRQHHPRPERFYLPQLKLCTHQATPPVPQVLAITSRLSISKSDCSRDRI